MKEDIKIKNVCSVTLRDKNGRVKDRRVSSSLPQEFLDALDKIKEKIMARGEK